jgi:hypothetical protein
MKRFVVTKWSGEFRYEKEAMTEEEVKAFVRANMNDHGMYADVTAFFDNLADAKIIFDEAKKYLSIKEFPSNGIMVIPWLTLEEEETDEDGELIPSDRWIEEFYPEKGEGNLS